MEATMRIRNWAMKLLKHADEVDVSKLKGIHVAFNKGDLDKGYWQQSFIEFSQDMVGYSIRYFPRRYIEEYSILGLPEKSYFEGWYTYANGIYDVYTASKEDIETCKKILKELKIV